MSGWGPTLQTLLTNSAKTPVFSEAVPLGVTKRAELLTNFGKTTGDGEKTALGTG